MKQPPTEFVRLIFLGDISGANHSDAPILDPAIVGALQSADLVIANCGSPVVRRPYMPVRSWFGLRRHMDAASLLGVISAMGIETDRLVLSVANPSILDQSVEGLEETLGTLRSLQIRTVGAGRGGLIHNVSVGALSVGLVAFSEGRRRLRRGFRRRVLLAEDLPKTGRLAETGQKADILCAFPHWKSGVSNYPSVRTQMLVGRLVEHGVGLVVGHHAQQIQPIQRLGSTYVAHGLGAFHRGAAREDLKRRIGGMFVVDISTGSRDRGQIAAYELFPFVRLAEGRGERIVPLDALPQTQRRGFEVALGHLSVGT